MSGSTLDITARVKREDLLDLAILQLAKGGPRETWKLAVVDGPAWREDRDAWAARVVDDALALAAQRERALRERDAEAAKMGAPGREVEAYEGELAVLRAEREQYLNADKAIDAERQKVDALDQKLAAAERERDEARAEKEKAEFSARQFCSAHIGKQFLACPACELSEVRHIVTETLPDLADQPDRETTVRRVATLATRYQYQRDAAALLRKDADAWRGAVQAILRAIMRTEPTRDATLEDLPKLVEYASGRAFRIVELEAEVSRLNARFGSYGDIVRPDWIDAPFTAAEHIPVLTAGAAEHLRAYAVSQERIVREQHEEIEKWRGEVERLRKKNAEQANLIHDLVVRDAKPAVPPIVTTATHVQIPRADYERVAHLLDGAASPAVCAVDVEAAAKEIADGFELHQGEGDTRTESLIVAILRKHTRAVEAAAGKIVDDGVTPPMSSGGRDYEVSCVAETLRAAPPSFHLTDIEAASYDVCAANYPGGIDSDRAEEVLRKHTRAVSVEEVAQAIMDAWQGRPGFDVRFMREGEKRREQVFEMARAALRALGVREAEKPLTTEEEDKIAQGIRHHEPLAEKNATCSRCGGAGWVWRHELDSPGEHDGTDDTRYSCPRCAEKNATPFVVNWTEMHGALCDAYDAITKTPRTRGGNMLWGSGAMLDAVRIEYERQRAQGIEVEP